MSVYRRPEYTRMVLNALRHNLGSQKYRLVVAVDCEGSRPNQEVLRIVTEQTWPVRLDLVLASEHQGCNRTIFSALDKAFEDSDYVIHIEDDILVARDALGWFEWARDSYRDDKFIFTVTDWRHPSGWLPDSERRIWEKEHSQARREGFFCCWGWATWQDRWEEIKANWTQKGDYELSWDVRISELRGDRVQIAPMISRAVNIGARLGTHRGHHPLKYWRGADSVFEIPEFYELCTEEEERKSFGNSQGDVMLTETGRPNVGSAGV